MTELKMITVAVIAAGLAVPAFASLPQVPANMAMPKGDAVAGAKTFVQCKACHVTTAGVNRIGPSLHAVVGRKAGIIPGYAYSAANKGSGLVWTEAELFTYLEAPRKVVPGTKMSYAGLKAPQDRANVIAYLKTQK